MSDPAQHSTTLDPNILDNLENYEDFLSAYIQIDQNTSTYSWFKADLLLHMMKKLGENSIRLLATDIKQPASTIINYTRTALAFPPEKRDEGASFTLHFQASFSDSLDEKTKTFKSAKRFGWLNKAIDEHLSTRKLAEYIQMEKAGETLPEKRDTAMYHKALQAVIETKKHLDTQLKYVEQKNDNIAYLTIIRLRNMFNNEK